MFRDAALNMELPAILTRVECFERTERDQVGLSVEFLDGFESVCQHKTERATQSRFMG